MTVNRVRTVTWHEAPLSLRHRINDGEITVYAVPDDDGWVFVIRDRITANLSCIVCKQPPHDPCDHVLEVIYDFHRPRPED